MEMILLLMKKLTAQRFVAPHILHYFRGYIWEILSLTNVEKSQANLRCELQSLTRLPESKFVLFCFKTYLFPLSELKAEGSGPALADAIEGLKTGNAPGMFKYKSAVRWGKSVQEYLRG